MKLMLMTGVAAATCLMAGAASAQDVGGWYAAFDIGQGDSEDWRGLSSKDLTQPSTAVASGPQGNAATTAAGYQTVGLSRTGLRNAFQQDAGISYDVRVGYRAAERWRLEGELTSVTNDLTGINIETGMVSPAAAAQTASATVTNPQPAVAAGARYNVRGPMNNVSGQFITQTVMLNVIWDISPDSVISPFVGVGGGFARVHLEASGAYPLVVSGGNQVVITAADSPRLLGFTGSTNSGFTIDDEDYVLAYQALVGATYKLSDRMNIDLTYRYTLIGDAEVEATPFGPAATPTAAAEQAGASIDPGSFHARREQQSLTIGLRWAFGG